MKSALKQQRATKENGVIVESCDVELDSIFKDNVSCSRIKYISDGLRVVGFILNPKNSAKKYPVLIFNRAGKWEEGKIGVRTLNYLSLLASRHYVVLASQYRGNDGGEGREAFGGEDINDVLNLIPLGESLPYADMGNLGMLGYSRGGMMTYLAAKSGAPLKAAAVIGAPTDLIATYRDRKDIKDDLCKLIGGPPKEYREEYIKRSAYYWPEKLNVPFLILHGGNDWRVSVKQSQKLVAKLDELNRPNYFKIFPGSDHNLSADRMLRNAMIFDWFASYFSR